MKCHKILSLLCFLCYYVQSAPIKVLVSVLPQKEMLELIGGEYIEVEVLIPPAKSPEIYEPNIEQMKHIAKAQVFFGVGMPFEATWLKRFTHINPTLIYHNLSNPTNAHNHSHNPHIWLSAQSVQPQISLISSLLSRIDPLHAEAFKQASTKLLSKLERITQQTHTLFAQPLAQKHFITYHPAFGEFARDFGLYEYSFEHDGKELKAQGLNQLLTHIKEKHIKVIFTQPQFASSRIQSFANALNLPILSLDPLSKSWLLSLQSNACQIAFSLALDEVSSCMQTYFKD